MMACWCSLSLSLEYFSLIFRLFWRARASVYPRTSFLSAWLLDVYLTRAVSCASLRSHIRGTRVIKEGTLQRDCNRRNCALSLTLSDYDRRGVSLSACGHVLIMNRCWNITDICMHNDPWPACVWEVSWHVRVQENNLCCLFFFI